MIGDGTVALATAATIEPAQSIDIPHVRRDLRPTHGPIDADVARLTAIGALLAAAESVGAAERMLTDARDYAAERRQFGRTIGSNQALRHILADMYVRRVSAWSTVLYAAAALDDDLPDAQQTAAIAKAYVGPRRARGRARRAAGLRRHRLHAGASGPPLPAPDHRARAAVRRRRPPRARARPRARRPRTAAGMTETGFNDPTAQRLERISTGADPDVVGPLLADVLHDPRWHDCDVALISGGKSNLTYRVACDAGEIILRRPPLGHILPTAHDMAREYRVLTALDGTAVPVPRTLYLGDELGAPFYVMERVLGHICRNALPDGYADAPEDRRAIGEALVDVLAALHTVDPAEVGLADFGRPAGFMARQLRRWSQQWEASRVDDLPALDALRDELVRTLPPSASTRSCTATSGSTTPSCTPPGPAASWPSWTGR